MIYVEHLLSCWESGVLVPPRQILSTQHLSIKTLGAESLMSFPGGQHLTCAATAAGWQKTLESVCLAAPGLQSMHLVLLPIVLYTL